MKAYETVVSYSGMSGHAVVVEFDLPYRMVFWSKAQYAGCWDLGSDVWFTSEWIETNSPENNHCYEPIMDKRLKYSNVEILESNAARVRVRWRYACNDLRYRIFHGNTRGEEIFTIYPDGIAVREVTVYPGDETSFGGNPNFWQVIEWITMIGTANRPEDVFFPDPALLFMNEEGESAKIQYPIQFDQFQPLCAAFPQISEWNMFIGSVRLRDRPNPFAILANDQRLFPHKPCSHCGKDHPYFTLFSKGGCLWRYPSINEDFVLSESGNNVIGERPVSASFIDGNYDMRPRGTGLENRKGARYLVATPPPGTSWLVLTGAGIQDPAELRELAVSWYSPARIVTGHEWPPDFITSGAAQSGSTIYDGYAYSIRAYTFRKFGVPRIEFRMEVDHPIVNPVFMVDGWESPNTVVEMDNVTLDRAMYSYAVRGNELILHLRAKIKRNTSFAIAETP